MSKYEKVNLNIPKKSHSALIGKGGSTVKSLQEDFHVKIIIPRREDDSNVVTISGDAKEVEACQKEIEQLLGFSVSTKPLVTITLDIPKNKHGVIMGSGGSNIRNLENNTGCQIKIPGKNDNSTAVTIQGTEDNVQSCKKEIENLINMKLTATTSKEPTSKKVVKDIDFNKTINEALFFPDKNNNDGSNYDFFLQYLSSAKKTCKVCVFTITDDRVADILIEHHKKGVEVRVITDNDTSVATGSDIQEFRSAGIPVRMDKTEFHMHNKFCVIDEVLLITGSYNWTSTASSKNNENMIITNNETLTKSFSSYFEDLWKEFA